MCWVNDSGSRIIESVAQENIPVFKICMKDLHNNIVPYYFSKKLTYVKGFNYTSVIYRFKNSLGEYEISDGLHSYSPKCTLISKSYNMISVLSPKIVRIGEYWVYNICMLLCVIPKGSTYYVNDNGEYVSDRLTVVDIAEFSKVSVWNKVLNKWVHRINII